MLRDLLLQELDASRELLHAIDAVFDADPAVESFALQLGEDGVVVVEAFADLANPEADGDKNGRVSVLEAFEYAVKLTNSYFERKKVLVTEHALIEDNGDGTGHQKAEAGDGNLAKLIYFDSLPQQQAGGDPVLAKLYSEKMRLEGEIEKLKSRKAMLKEEDYENELEKVLIELAKLNQNIKAGKKRSSNE